MLSETSAALVDIVEHPTRVPTATKAKKAKNEFRIFIFSPFDATSVNLPRNGPNSLTECPNGGSGDPPKQSRSGTRTCGKSKMFQMLLPSITRIAPATAAE